MSRVLVTFKSVTRLTQTSIYIQISRNLICLIMNVYRISAITLLVNNMQKSCKFYSKIPGFRLVYGGSFNTFTTYQVGESIPNMHLNLELKSSGMVRKDYNNKDDQTVDASKFGRIIFHTEDVDELYRYLKNNETISEMISFENEPKDATWGERYFHVREPDGYQLSFANPIKKNQ
jgi:catechol 2,3-dioxygenase-like lactoylglutathione lyase family enzyme